MTDLPPLDIAGAAQRYDAVIRRVARDKRIRRSSAERRFVEMLKFLDVCSVAEASVSPSYCETRFGRFIHHDPMDAPDHVAYQRASEEVGARYGLDSRVWRQPRAVWLERGAWIEGASGGG